jgi:hypothetical protein
VISLGSTGKKDFENFLKGSMSEKVERNTKVPLLVVSSKSLWKI